MHKEVSEIKRKLITAPWPKFLESISIAGLHNWNGETIDFKFPVTVISGENGSGKSTILKVAASAYKEPGKKSSSYYPSIFFPDSAWETVSGVKLTYKIKEGSKSKQFNITRPSERWSYPKVSRDRNVIFQDISRTLPLDSKVGYSYLAQRKSKEISANSLDTDFKSYYCTIMGRRYEEAKFATTDIHKEREIGVLKISGYEYSQFHQGAGEDATLDLMLLLQNVPNTSLILIDEIEASLHPRSQRRIVHFLLWLARTKNIQVILTSHSSYILEELPIDARIFLINSSNGMEVIYGSTSNFALNRMDDYEIPDLYLFVEDNESKILLMELLRNKGIDLKGIKIMNVGPANNVVTIGRIASQEKLPVNSLSVVDADQSTSEGCIKLPGTKSPEVQIFDDILESACQYLAAKLELSEESVRSGLEHAMTHQNHHEWISSAATNLNNQTQNYLWVSMCQVWAKHCVDDKEYTKFVEDIKSKIKSE